MSEDLTAAPVWNVWTSGDFLEIAVWHCCCYFVIVIVVFGLIVIITVCIICTVY